MSPHIVTFAGTRFNGVQSRFNAQGLQPLQYLVTNGLIHSFDLSADNKVSNQKEFSTMMVDGVQCRTDGIRVDVNGNLWCGSNAGRTLGYSGVTVWSPDGKILRRIRLPETCANLCLGGPKRNRLFMCASQSLYSVYVETQGAHIT